MNKCHLSLSIYGPRNLKIRGNVGIFEEKVPERRDLLEAKFQRILSKGHWHDNGEILAEENKLKITQ